MDLNHVYEEAMRRATVVIERTLEGLEAAPVSQDKLRAAFEQAVYTQGGIEAFAAEHGDEEAVRQGALLVARRQRDEVS